MSWGKYRIVLPETKEVLLTVAWGSITEAVAVSDMIGSRGCRPEDNSPTDSSFLNYPKGTRFS